MTIKEFCEKYNKDEKNVRAKVFRYKNELKDHISKTPYTKTLNLDDYAVEFLLEDRRGRYNQDIPEQPTEEDTTVRPNDVDMFPHWSAEKKRRVMDICFREVKKYWYSLRYIPDEFKTYELCKYAVENQGLALEYVPKWFVTQEICDIAVKENGIALAYVPEKYMTKEMVKIAFDNCASMQKRVKRYMMTIDEMDADDHLLKYVPDRFIDKDICLKALVYCASNAQYIPPKYMEDEAMISEANKDIVSRKYIPKWYWTKEHVIETIKKYTDDKRFNGLVGIPREAFDYDFYLELIESKLINPEDVYQSEYYSEILSASEKNSIRQIDIDRYNRSEELYGLVQKDSNNIRLIPLDDERYETYATLAVCKCGETLKYIPVERRDFDLCRAAIEDDPNAMRYVPDEFKEQIVEEIKHRTNWLRYLFDDGYFSDILSEM